MSIKDFQTFITTDSQLQNSPYGPCVRTVNLLHLHDSSSPYGFGPMQAAAYAAAAQRTQTPMARNNLAQMQRMGMIQRGPMPIQPIMVQNRVALVLDAESCLDRLYGGYFPGIFDLDVAFVFLLFTLIKLLRLNVSYFRRLELWRGMETHVLLPSYYFW